MRTNPNPFPPLVSPSTQPFGVKPGSLLLGGDDGNDEKTEMRTNSDSFRNPVIAPIQTSGADENEKAETRGKSNSLDLPAP